MENHPLPSLEVTQEATVVYPPKFVSTDPAPIQVWTKSLTSLALYLIIGYMIFQSFDMLLLITCIIVIHELGHFLAMKVYGYKDLGIFFIPLLGAYVSGRKREVSQVESAVITLAGPVPGIVIGAVFYFLHLSNEDLFLGAISYRTIGLSFVILNLINLFPVYPLDGGQLLNRVFLDEDSWVSKIFVWLSIGFLVWFALFGFSKPFYALLIFPAFMILRMFGDSKLNAIDKKLELEGIDMNKSYEDLSNEDYWRIRNILATSHPGFNDLNITPPFEYSAKEEKVKQTIESLLHRNLIQDMSIAGKVLVLIIWIASIASPWLIGADMSFLARFGL